MDLILYIIPVFLMFLIYCTMVSINSSIKKLTEAVERKVDPDQKNY